MTAHVFAESLAIGAEHERTLDTYFEGRGWAIAKATRAEQRDGIDRWLTRDGHRRSVEYKADVRSDSTGNYALELVSSVPDAEVDGRFGWALKPGAERLALYRPTSRRLAIIEGRRLRAHAKATLARNDARLRSVRNASWTSLVLLVPLASVESIASQCLEVTP
jgi:hypothetical protein